MQGHDTERLKIDDTTWQCECVQCQELFTSTRSDASFCSTRCRVAFSREPQKRLNALEEIRTMHHRLAAIQKKYNYDDEVFQQFLSLEKQIKHLVNQFERGD